MSRAVDELDSAGLREFEQPEYTRPHVSPDSLSEVGHKDLMDLLVQLTAWGAYAAAQAARAIVYERVAEDVYEELKAVKYVAHHDTRKNVADTRNFVQTLPEVQDARTEHHHRMAFRKLVEQVASSLESEAFVVSREISRRTSFEPSHRRADRATT